MKLILSQISLQKIKKSTNPVLLLLLLSSKTLRKYRMRKKLKYSDAKFKNESLLQETKNIQIGMDTLDAIIDKFFSIFITYSILYL